MMKRRDFLAELSLACAALLGAPGLLAAPLKAGESDRLGTLMPTRLFGNTGERVTVFGLGGFHVGMAKRRGIDPQPIIEKALEGGVRFFDNAYNYNKGLSEQIYGEYLTPQYRDDIFLMSKSQATSANTARAQLETSLRRMKTDYLDLWVMHSVKDPADAERRFENGIWDVFREAKASGKVRYIGYSGHKTTAAHRDVMARVGEEVDYVQLPVNAVDASADDSFTTRLLPELATQGCAIGAMKAFSDGRFFGHNLYATNDPIIPNYLSVEEALWYVLSQPVTCLVSGNDKLEYLEENLEIFRRFEGMSADEQARIVAKVAKFADDEKLVPYRHR